MTIIAFSKGSVQRDYMAKLNISEKSEFAKMSTR